MGLNIGNCPRCGKIYVTGVKEFCPACMKDIEDMYEICLKYLRDNRGASITELSEATDVTVKQITKFIKEGRISLANAPNLGYPCEVCGTLIREGAICDSCRQRLVKDIRSVNETMQKQESEPSQQRNIYNFREKPKGDR